ncbi:MAG: hypothetical protein EXS63_08510 [Candidatus Omnitrophica bacterium]|nr:hypothetical protein [Candidatus Omnitrophota bacterium]
MATQFEKTALTDEQAAFDWIRQSVNLLPSAMERFKRTDISGAFRYSLSGDLPQNHWGLGNTCFAVKIHSMLGRQDQLDREAVSKFINSFQDSWGALNDPEIRRRSAFVRFGRAFKHLNFSHWDYRPIERAETRQAYAALINLGKKPERPYRDIPDSISGIQKYIERLNWENPWSAASHFSHLIFFLKYNQQLFGILRQEAPELIRQAFLKLDSLQQKDGSWYAEGISLPDFQKVNAAMKVMLAYETMNSQDFKKAESLIDLCLSSVNDGHACNHFNVVCVLYACSRKTDYRQEAIRRYFLERLEKFKEHYYPETGGFSFLPGKANTHYYAAKVTRGRKEPDLHGTHLFLWGIVLISDFLGLRKKLNLQFPIT